MPFRAPGDAPGIVRDFPIPFRAMLSISTDIDWTSIENFRETHRFLNTRANTAVGDGVGLDVANSFWVFGLERPGYPCLSYYRGWTERTETPIADELVGYIRAGWIDTLHTYGDFSRADQYGASFARAHALDTLELFARKGLSLPVWTNHGDACNTQNIGGHGQAQGDLAGSGSYHADLLPQLGVQYLWRQTNQATPGHRLAVDAWRLKDGSAFFGFSRFNTSLDHPGAAEIGRRFGVRHGADRVGRPWMMLWHPKVFHEQVHDEILDRIERNRQFSIMAQHLGFFGPLQAPDRNCVTALRRLRRRQDEGRILVARTSRLLHYSRVRDHAVHRVIPVGDRWAVDIRHIDDPVRGRWMPRLEDLRGLAFRVDHPERWLILLDGRPIDDAEIVRASADPDDTSIGLRWFAEDHTDHSHDFTRGAASNFLIWRKDAEDEVTALGASILAYLETELARAEGIREMDAAVRYSAGRYEVGLAHYTKLMETIGFSRMERGLDIGSGAGHWCLAFLRHGARHVVGIDRRASYVGLAGRLAQQFGFGDRAAFIVGRAEELPLQPETFDAAWSHGVIQFTDAEPVIGEAARTLRQGGYFYCAHTLTGLRLRLILSHLAAGRAPMALTQARIILNGQLERLGVHHTVGGRVRTLETDDLLRIGRAFGLTYVAQPGLQDEPGEFLGFPDTADFVVQKSAEPDFGRRQLVAGDGIDSDWRADLHALVRSGCGALVAEILEAYGAGDEELRRLHALALIRSGRGRSPKSQALFERDEAERRLDPRTLGLYWYDRGNMDTALAWFGRANSDAADRDFLVGMCHVAAERWLEAAQTFSAGLRQAPADLPLAIGLTAARLGLGDDAGGRAAFERFCRLQRDKASDETIEEAIDFMTRGARQASVADNAPTTIWRSRSPSQA